MRILVASNDVTVHAAVMRLRQLEPDAVTIAEANDLDVLAVQLQEFSPDLLLLDWELPGRVAAALLFARFSERVRCLVIVLSGHAESAQKAIQAGAYGFVSKGDPPEQLLIACRRAIASGAGG